MNYNEQFCAFIDILGFRNQMSNFEKALGFYRDFFNEYNIFNKLHDSIVNTVSNGLQQSELLTVINQPSVDDLIFSDSIIMYSEDWKALLFKVANVMSILLSKEFLFRGGIGYGKYYSEIKLGHTYIVSEGLVQASEIESKISKYPRIVLSKQALNQILNQMDSLYDLNNLLIQDEDNYWFINPFFLNPDIRPIQEYIKHKAAEYCNEKYVEKYIWMEKLCQYFSLQDYIRKDPIKYYLDETNQYHFFYPKTFHIHILDDRNYSLNENIYRQTFQENIEQIVYQK